MFPSNTSGEARGMLLESLRTLNQPHHIESMSPHSLFRCILSIQALVDDLELSHIDSVSWPIVSYCDEMWKSIFGENDRLIFYSTTRKYNYNIAPFSDSLRPSPLDVLPKAEVSRIIDREIYCLHLASLEHDNLSLYANVAHEFGHSIYLRLPAVIECWRQSFTEVLEDAMNAHSEPATSKRRRLKTFHILQGLAKELFADSFAAFAFGPSFFLSLYEMTWGNPRNSWNVMLSPKVSEISAHPSGNYRLGRLKDRMGLEGFVEQAKIAFNRLGSEHLRSMAALFERISIDPADGSVSVAPLSDNDSIAIQAVLSDRLAEIRTACNVFTEKCWQLLQGEYPHLKAKITAENISLLLKRLENDVLPNIIPDGSLLGTPAAFEEILLASAMYRMSLLLPEAKDVDSENTSNNLRKLERLARKSFEATWIQKTFTEWKTSENE